MMILSAAFCVAYLWLGVHLWQRLVMGPLDETAETDLVDRLWMEQQVQSVRRDAVVVWLTFVLFWPLFCVVGFCLSRLPP